MSRQERYRARVEISMLFRAANQFEDRQSEEGRVKAAAISRSQRRRVGVNALGNWAGFIGRRKVKDFGENQNEAWKWRNETE